MFAPDRLLHPMRRVGAKGSGAFERIGWEDALDVIAERFSKIIEVDGAEALLPFQYLGAMGVVQRQALVRLFHALGASRLGGSSSFISDCDDFLASVESWHSKNVSEVCGIDESVVIELARQIASARPALIRVGVGPQQTVNGDALVRGLSALSLLAGHWQHRGGGLFAFVEPEFDDYRASCPQLVPGKPRTLDMATLGSILTDPTLMPQVNGLMIWTANPAVSQIDAARVRRGLAREDLFTVVLEHFLTDTARYADIVLPSTTQLEHFDIQGAWGHHYISLNLPAITPLGESKSHGEIMRALAKRMGLEIPALQESDEEIVAAALPPNVSLADLNRNGWQKASPPTWRPEDLEAGLRITSDELVDLNPPPAGSLQLLTPKSHIGAGVSSTLADRAGEYRIPRFDVLRRFD